MLLLVKIRNCSRVLVEGFPPGVVGIPTMHIPIKITLPNTATRWTPTVDVFPCIGANSGTPEKLQGVNLEFKLFVGPLDRHGYSESCLYVAFSRVSKLENLVLTEPLTMEYIRKFTPPMAVLMQMKSLLERVNVPPYGTEEDKAAYQEWLRQEKEYLNQAFAIHYAKKGTTGKLPEQEEEEEEEEDASLSDEEHYLNSVSESDDDDESIPLDF